MPTGHTSIQLRSRDESEPLSKKVKIELKDINSKHLKPRDKEPCDTKTTPSTNDNKNPEVGNLKHDGGITIPLEVNRAKTVQTLQATLQSSIASESQDGKNRFVAILHYLHSYLFLPLY